VPEDTEFKECFEKLFHSKKEADHFNFSPLHKIGEKEYRRIT
jgi:hypothetical protein